MDIFLGRNHRIQIIIIIDLKALMFNGFLSHILYMKLNPTITANSWGLVTITISNLD